MHNYWNKINWPDIPDVRHLLLRIEEFPDYLHNQNGIQNYSQAVNLKEWPTLNEDVKHCVPDHIPRNLISLQRVLPPGLPWHTDRNRPFAAMSIITGPAYTVFQESNKPMQRVNFKLNQWYIFDGSIPHCVKGCQTTRLAICVDLSSLYKNYESACNELCH